MARAARWQGRGVGAVAAATYLCIGPATCTESFFKHLLPCVLIRVRDPNHLELLTEVLEQDLAAARVLELEHDVLEYKAGHIP